MKEHEGQSGQIIIEYVLLLVIVIALSAFIWRGMTSRDLDNPGFLMSQWDKVLKQIANDDVNQ